MGTGFRALVEVPSGSLSLAVILHSLSETRSGGDKQGVVMVDRRCRSSTCPSCLQRFLFHPVLGCTAVGHPSHRCLSLGVIPSHGRSQTRLPQDRWVHSLCRSSLRDGSFGVPLPSRRQALMHLHLFLGCIPCGLLFPPLPFFLFLLRLPHVVWLGWCRAT